MPEFATSARQAEAKAILRAWYGCKPTADECTRAEWHRDCSSRLPRSPCASGTGHKDDWHRRDRRAGRDRVRALMSELPSSISRRLTIRPVGRFAE